VLIKLILTVVDVRTGNALYLVFFQTYRGRRLTGFRAASIHLNDRRRTFNNEHVLEDRALQSIIERRNV